MSLVLNIGSGVSTINPALYVLKLKGYSLRVEAIKEEHCLYIAVKDGRRFVGNSAPETLGLVTMWECLGDEWRSKLPGLPDVLSECIVPVEEHEEGTDDGLFCSSD
jgi:hypothetical protein